MSAAGGRRPRPLTTVTDRCASQWRASRSQLSFTAAGQTTTAGNASSASSAASASTVVPSPCSSARKVPRASSAYSTAAH